MSKIEWTDKTWNPVTGCTKVSQGCKNCYAERMYERFNGKGSFKQVICHAERLDHPLRWKKPAMVFVNSMSDLFHEDVPFKFIDDVFDYMHAADWHRFQVLTKRGERMLAYYNWKKEGNGFNFPVWPLPNVWLGISVENQAAADERIPLLLQVPAAVRFLSCEPLLGPVDFKSFPFSFRQLIHWVICGGESGPGARAMHPDWARQLRDQCKDAGVPFFFKQWGEWMPINMPWEDDDFPDEPLQSNEQWLNLAGGSGFHGNRVYRMRKVGKKKAGRLLDGQLHDEFPKTK